ncbi:hypothetical protein, partial [Petrocella sp. FN5]|uniref:hypothetical protein n=1 Tax=Petrocella sp. FN5 TaxID=3032002 RepID=UPI0023DBAF65
IYIMSLMFPYLAEAGRRLLWKHNLYRSLFTLMTFTIGLFIEFDRIMNAFKKGFKINPLGVLTSVIILVILFLPASVGMTITGFGTMSIIMQQGFSRSILGIISGVLFARSI